MDGDAPFLPQEIITSILQRLPVKSLIRFQCVCKHWKNLFTTPSFIAHHLHHSTQNPSLLFQRYGIDHPLNLYLLDCDMQVRELHNGPLTESYGSSSCVGIIGSCNGLLCVEIIGYKINSLFLWNPAIRKVKQLPRTINYFMLDCCSGFGFSPIVNDYKIVKIYAELGGLFNQVEMYSLSTGSWKEFEFGKLEGVKVYCQTVTANGVIYWPGLKLGVEEEEEGNDDISVIVSFDIAMEVFTLIPMPALCSDSGANLTVYNNKLAMLCHTEIGNFESSLIDLWVMEEGIVASGERWSWTKKYSISSSSGMLYPFSIWMNEIVCNIDETDAKIGVLTDLSLLNFNTYELKKFDISSYGHEFCLISNHVETLVSVDNNHIEDP